MKSYINAKKKINYSMLLSGIATNIFAGINEKEKERDTYLRCKVGV